MMVLTRICFLILLFLSECYALGWATCAEAASKPVNLQWKFFLFFTTHNVADVHEWRTLLQWIGSKSMGSLVSFLVQYTDLHEWNFRSLVLLVQSRLPTLLGADPSNRPTSQEGLVCVSRLWTGSSRWVVCVCVCVPQVQGCVQTLSTYLTYPFDRFLNEK